MTLLWSYLFVTSFHQVELGEDALTARWLGRTAVIPYDDVTAVTHQERLAIVTSDTTYRLHLTPFRNTQAALYAALLARIPAIRAARDTALPIVLKPRGMVQMVLTIYFLLGVGMAVFGAAIIWDPIQNPTEYGWFQRIIMPVMGLVSLAIAGMTAHQFLWSFVWRYTFGADWVRLRYGLRVCTFAAADIMDIELDHEPRTYRGVTRQIYFLNIWLADGEIVRISPNGAGYPSDYSEVEEGQILTDLLERLRFHYGLEKGGKEVESGD